VIAAVERMARADRRQATELSAYDADTMIFNAVNGTIDLTTGELLKHNPITSSRSAQSAKWRP
jgi:putative DNA primase/helicase